ncbi:CCA tRNA nucleotidyltransferase [Atopococcus tabaci]|uniref:CCA tRNA nucleotidyltransferase n=1 Tax=Atopococcus tabaci TaxID=269774 RepID=UPI000425BBD2|nr:CCA tRNA nucleotidyltransferase [Atopococcus tabaci]
MPKQLKMNETFLEAVPILRRLQENEYEAYFVGGSVRDALLGKEIEDVDIATSAFPEEVKSLFTRTIDVGIEHGTVMVLFEGQSYEITTFRTESEYQDYRRPDHVTFVRSLEEDLKRRDFTINALAMDENGHIIDYFNGMEDMSHRLIKAVGEPSERFYEDALRMMRAVRFQAQLDFHLDEKTFAAIKEHHSLLEKISVERIQVEFTKMMLGQGYKKGIQSFIDSGLYRYCPELRGEKEALEKMCRLNGPLTSTIQMWTLLLHFIGLSPEEVEPFMRKWKCSKKEISTVKKALIGLSERLQSLPSNRYVFEMGLDVGLEVERMLELLHQDALPERIQQIYQQLPIQRRNELAVNGNELMTHLNKKAGKWLGPLLDELERAVVEMEVENEKHALLQTAETWTVNEEK